MVKHKIGRRKGVRPFAYTSAEKKLPKSVHRKYERCVLKVKRKLPKKCKRLGFPGIEKNVKGCVNPWAVCRHIYKSTVRKKQKRRER